MPTWRACVRGIGARACGMMCAPESGRRRAPARCPTTQADEGRTTRTQTARSKGRPARPGARQALRRRHQGAEGRARPRRGPRRAQCEPGGSGTQEQAPAAPPVPSPWPCRHARRGAGDDIWRQRARVRAVGCRHWPRHLAGAEPRQSCWPARTGARQRRGHWRRGCRARGGRVCRPHRLRSA